MLEVYWEDPPWELCSKAGFCPLSWWFSPAVAPPASAGDRKAERGSSSEVPGERRSSYTRNRVAFTLPQSCDGLDACLSTYRFPYVLAYVVIRSKVIYPKALCPDPTPAHRNRQSIKGKHGPGQPQALNTLYNSSIHR